MSKVVLGFKSPYHQQYAEAHAGGRLALSLRFAGYDALVVRGKANQPSCLIVGRHHLEVRNIEYLWGHDVFSTGKWLRKIQKAGSGHRSIIRIGPAGENQSPYACINVDSYRHFGRLGAGAIMGGKNLKAMIVLGDGHVNLPEGREYSDLYKDIYKEVTESEVMRKYHDLGTPVNVLVLNAIQSLPWRNLQATQSEHAESISGERFAEQLLLRQTACSGCPVGCIHVGLLREMFAREHEFIYRQVSYDHEPIFAMGTMLGMTRPSDVLTLIEEADRQGLDVMSTGVALAWATEALEKGVISESETLVPLSFDDVHEYRRAIEHVAVGTNDFYRLLAQGTEKAAAAYGGRDFACVLGQEMAGYATGEVFFVSQAYGFRHSHLDSGGYGYDQKNHDKDVDAVVQYLLDDEHRRVELTCMVACLFSRNVYTRERLQNALTAIGQREAADDLSGKASRIQAFRWRLKFKTGYDPAGITISQRFRGITTFKGELDQDFMDRTAQAYQKATQLLASGGSGT